MNEMATFTRVVESEEFRARGRKPVAVTLGRVEDHLPLEDRLRVKLLTRTTANSPSRWKASVISSMRARFSAPSRPLRARDRRRARQAERRHPVNVGTAVGKHQLAPILGRFLEHYPEISVELSVTDRQIDIIAEQADVVLRTGALSDSSLQARKLTDSHRLICASPDYLARHGTPRVPADLLQHNCLLISRCLISRAGLFIRRRASIT